MFLHLPTRGNDDFRVQLELIKYYHPDGQGGTTFQFFESQGTISTKTSPEEFDRLLLPKHFIRLITVEQGDYRLNLKLVKYFHPGGPGKTTFTFLDFSPVTVTRDIKEIDNLLLLKEEKTDVVVSQPRRAESKV